VTHKPLSPLIYRLTSYTGNDITALFTSDSTAFVKCKSEKT